MIEITADYRAGFTDKMRIRYRAAIYNTVYYKTMLFFTTKMQFFERELFQNGYKQ